MTYTDDTPVFLSFLREKVPSILETDIICVSSFTIKNVQKILYKIIKSYQQDKAETLSERNLKSFATGTTSKFNFFYNEILGQHNYGDIQYNEAIDKIIQQDINDDIVTLQKKYGSENVNKKKAKFIFEKFKNAKLTNRGATLGLLNLYGLNLGILTTLKASARRRRKFEDLEKINESSFNFIKLNTKKDRDITDTLNDIFNCFFDEKGWDYNGIIDSPFIYINNCDEYKTDYVLTNDEFEGATDEDTSFDDDTLSEISVEDLSNSNNINDHVDNSDAYESLPPVGKFPISNKRRKVN